MLLAVVMFAAACGDNLASTVDAGFEQVVTETETLPAGNLIEGSWTAGPSDAIGLSITTTGFIDWDIHAHADGGTQEVTAQFGASSVTYEFVPSQTAQWYLLIRNSDTAQPVSFTVQMTLYGAAAWDGWQ